MVVTALLFFGGLHFDFACTFYTSSLPLIRSNVLGVNLTKILSAIRASLKIHRTRRESSLETRNLSFEISISVSCIKFRVLLQLESCKSRSKVENRNHLHCNATRTKESRKFLRVYCMKPLHCDTTLFIRFLIKLFVNAL